MYKKLIATVFLSSLMALSGASLGGSLPFTLVNIHGWFAKDQTSFCLLNLVRSLQPDSCEKLDYSFMLKNQITEGNLSYINDFYQLKGPEQYLGGLHLSFRHDYKQDLRTLFGKLREKKFKDGKKILIYAHCNGGAKLLSCPEIMIENRDIIDAIIIESAPTNFEESAYGAHRSPLYYVPFIGGYLAKLASLFICGAQRQPIVLLQEGLKQQLDIPILIMHSKTDRVVPCTQSMRLYEILHSLNPDTYLAMCPTGVHSRLLSTKNQVSYGYIKTAWQTFLTKHGFINPPYREDLNNYQFSPGELQKAYGAHAARRYFCQVALLVGSSVAYCCVKILHKLATSTSYGRPALTAWRV